MNGRPIASISLTGEVVVDHRRPEIALQQPPDVDEVLVDQRLIEIVVGPEVGQRVRRQRALAVERTARREPQDEEAGGDRDERDREGRKHPPQGVTEHRLRNLPMEDGGSPTAKGIRAAEGSAARARCDLLGLGQPAGAVDVLGDCPRSPGSVGFTTLAARYQ